MKTKTLLLQSDMAIYLDMLSDEEAGILFKALFRYINDNEELETDNRVLKMAFSVACGQISRSLEKYEQICIRRKENARKRWERNENTATDANVEKPIQTNTNECNSMQMDANAYKSMQMDANAYKCIEHDANAYKCIQVHTSVGNPNPNPNPNPNICSINTIVYNTPDNEDLKEKNTLSRIKKEKTAAETAADAAERVVKLIEKEKNDFWKECETFIKAYGEEMVRDFYGYWTEDFQHGTGFRKQKEKTWNTARRLSTWARKQMEINNRYGSRNIGRGYDLSTPEGRAKDAAERIARNIQEECSDDDWMP